MPRMFVLGSLAFLLSIGAAQTVQALEGEARRTVPPPSATALGDELRGTYAMLSYRRTPLWVSDNDGHEVNCGGLDLFEIAEAAQHAGVVQTTPDMLGSARFTLHVGERLKLQFKSALNRDRYAEMIQSGRAVPAYACWCAYGMAHPRTPHLAAANNAVVTLRTYADGRSALFFNLRERAASWSVNPGACIQKSEQVALTLVEKLDMEMKRGFDRTFDTPPGSRALPTEECPSPEP